MAVLSSFEVLAELLVPKGVTPPPGGSPLPAVPFVVQAYFVQVSFPKGGSAKSVSFDLTFEETTNFSQGVGPTGLLAQFIDDKGVVNNYDSKQFFNPPAGKSPGFLNQSIAPGQTKIYSITALPPKPATTAAAVAVPQSGTGWRGSAILTPNPANQLIATPTQRQIYFSSADLKTVADSVVYAVPTGSGKTVI